MSRSDERKVGVAVALLPKDARDRYREQWESDLRDAASLGIRESEIASGALALAARFPRPLPTWIRATPPRVSFALALSTALIVLSQFASLIPVSDGITTTISGSIASTPLIAWVVLIPVVAFIMILAARRASARERAAVILLVGATYLPFLRPAIDSLAPWQWDGWLTFGTYAYLGSAILVVVALISVWREYSLLQPVAGAAHRTRTIVLSSIAALTVGGLVALCSLNESASWNSRRMAVWVDPLTTANRADYNQWLTGWAQGEDLTVHLLSIWLVVGMIVAAGIVLFGFSRRATLARIIILAAGVCSFALISFGGLIMFLQIESFTVVATVPVDAVMFGGRLGLLVVTMAAVGGLGARRASTGSATEGQTLSAA
jgi:hypothetical protein